MNKISFTFLFLITFLALSQPSYADFIATPGTFLTLPLFTLLIILAAVFVLLTFSIAILKGIKEKNNPESVQELENQQDLTEE